MLLLLVVLRAVFGIIVHGAVWCGAVWYGAVMVVFWLLLVVVYNVPARHPNLFVLQCLCCYCDCCYWMCMWMVGVYTVFFLFLLTLMIQVDRSVAFVRYSCSCSFVFFYVFCTVGGCSSSRMTTKTLTMIWRTAFLLFLFLLLLLLLLLWWL